MKPLICLVTIGLSTAVLAPFASAQGGFHRPYLHLQSPMADSIAISEGDLRVYARSQDDNGLLRDVIIELADGSILMRAKYARRDPKRAGQWIVGDGLFQTFRADGTLSSESRFARFAISAPNPTRLTSAQSARQVVIDGGLQLRAASQDSGGLLRDVLIKLVAPQSETDAAATEFGIASSLRIFAKYARRDPKQPLHWILGDAVMHNFGLDGSLRSEQRTKQLEVWTKPQSQGTFGLVFKQMVDVPTKLRTFAPTKPQNAAPAKPKSVAPRKGGFQLLAG